LAPDALAPKATQDEDFDFAATTTPSSSADENDQFMAGRQRFFDFDEKDAILPDQDQATEVFGAAHFGANLGDFFDTEQSERRSLSEYGLVTNQR